MMEQPRRLGLMILFGFEVDTLEIALREQHHLVDKVFLVESTRTHKGMEKPLLWEKLKSTERFQFLDPDKILHIIVDIDINSGSWDSIWHFEDTQTSIGIARVKEWVKLTRGLKSGDIFISANVDEVLSRTALHKLKYCGLVSPVLSGAIVMPMGSLERAMRTEFPVMGRPHSFAQPSLYDWGGVEEGIFDGKRMIMTLRSSEHGGPIERYVTGGIHMTGTSFVATTFLKDLTATEYSGKIGLDLLGKMTLQDIENVQKDTYNLGYSPRWADMMDPIEKVQDMEMFVPWFLKCNPDRFPYWFGKSDSRNRELYSNLKTYFTYH